MTRAAMRKQNNWEGGAVLGELYFRHIPLRSANRPHLRAAPAAKLTRKPRLQSG
jgi:hypothetical protein